MAKADASPIGGVSHKRGERLVRILSIVEEAGSASLVDLVERLEVSQASVRRDLAELADRRLVTRTHGGVRALDTPELPPELRSTRSEAAKRLIARAVAQRIPRERHAIALSGGSTTAYVAAELVSRPELTLVTNSLTIGEIAHDHPDARIVLTGGTLRPQSLEMVGPIATHAFSGMHTTWAVLGVDGISATAGVTTHDDTEAHTNRAMVAAAKQTVVVADGSKIGAVRLAEMVPVSDVDILVTDPSADGEELERIRRLGVEVIVASERGDSAG